MMRSGVLAAIVIAIAGSATAHDSKPHAPPDNGAVVASTGTPLPLNLGGPFSLIDQDGHRRTEADPEGHLQLLFFGYANCREICSAALPQMAAIAQGLRTKGVSVTPVMITVDPARDTVATLKPALQKFGEGFVGLTGPEQDLAAVYKLYAVDTTLVFEDPASGPVYAHNSLFYLLDAQGKFLTIIPPILTDQRAIDIIAAHAPAG